MIAKMSKEIDKKLLFKIWKKLQSKNKSKSHQEFEKLLSEDLENRKFKEGEITTGTCRRNW